MRKPAAVRTFLIFCCAGGLWIACAGPSVPDEELRQVTAGSTTLLDRPVAGSEVLETLRRGRLLRPIDSAQEAGYLEVETFQGRRGFARPADLATVRLSDRAFWEIENENALAPVCDDDEACWRRQAERTRDELGAAFDELPDGFSIALNDGSNARFKNGWNEIEFNHYRPLFARDDAGTVLIAVRDFFGTYYTLLDRRSGRRLRLPGIPVASPDKSRLAVLGTSVRRGRSAGRIMIVKRTRSDISVEWQREVDWYPGRARWMTDDLLEIDLYRNLRPPDVVPAAMSVATALLRRTDTGWRIEND